MRLHRLGQQVVQTPAAPAASQPLNEPELSAQRVQLVGRVRVQAQGLQGVVVDFRQQTRGGQQLALGRVEHAQHTLTEEVGDQLFRVERARGAS
ncbi:hypothetical protein FSC37_20940 [Piscinibacter aquaticus]|uniref:Uncharacterized protein n=1 Tax=Piscinibacter aquaticus TaxID=392597 RepID=A0A5C6U6B0_9BURK|nr:hypothetical protein FSC37_20940 [Piscinibacter aquaticus]